MSDIRVMPKMLDYQKEIVENISATTIIGNMPRGGGKDYILACKVLYERPKTCLYMNWTSNQFKALQEKFNEIFNTSPEIKDVISYFSNDRNKIKIMFNNGDISEIYNYNSLKQEDKLLNTCVDMMLYSNCLPQFDINTKKHIAMVSISYTWLKNFYPCKSIEVYNIKLKQLVDNNLMKKEWLDKIRQDCGKLSFKQEFDLFDEYEEIFNIHSNIDEETIKINKNNFYDIEIKELMEEYDGIPKNKNTTLTRENILKQIIMIQEIKKNNI